MNRRSDPKWWLIGGPLDRFSTSRLPTCGEALRYLQTLHDPSNAPLWEVTKQTIEAVMEIWMRVRIPVQWIDSCIRSLEKLNLEYQTQKKSRMKATQGYKDQDAVFQSTLATMKNEEDREFYWKQLQDVFSCSMAGEDMVTAGKEGRKRSREEEGERRRQQYEEREARSSQAAAAALPSSTSSSSQVS